MHVVVGSTFATPIGIGAISQAHTDFFLGAYQQSGVISKTFTGLIAEVNVKCGAVDSDAVLQTELNAMQLSWNGTTVVN